MAVGVATMWTVGKVAEYLGLHPDTLRRYEKRGLIPRAFRSPLNGYRVWSEEEVGEIHRVIFGTNFGSRKEN